MNGINRVAALTALISLTTLAGCGVGEAKVGDIEEQSAATPLPVEVSLAKTADIFATYETTTTIASDSEAPILARVGGEVVEILVEEGDRVVEGQVLARLDGDRLRLQMLQAKADMEKTAKEYERFVNLHERGLVSSSAYEGLKFDLDALKASYELKQLDYNYTYIRAPISGVVSARDIKVGTQVDVNTPTFRITDTARLVAYLRIPQTELEKFSIGDKAEISVDAIPDRKFVARIARISPTIDARNGTFRATTYIDNADSSLAPGMFGRFTIAYELHEMALVIPATALIREDGEDVVYVVEDGAAVRRPVNVGIESDGQVEVLGGISKDDKIVVTGQGGLRDGSRVLASNLSTENVTG